MSYKKTSQTIITAIETRVKLNVEKGNFAPIKLIITESELKEQLGLERLKSVTRKRLIAALTDEGYIVTDEGAELLIEVDVAGRTTDFDSLEALVNSLEDE